MRVKEESEKAGYWYWGWSSNTLTTWIEELTHWKRPWYWERLKAEGEEGNRGWDIWMASLIQCTWTWANSGRWWETGKPGFLQSMWSQRVGHDLTMVQQQKQYPEKEGNIRSFSEPNTCHILSTVLDSLIEAERESQNNEQDIVSIIEEFSSVTQLCPTLCNPMNCSTPGLPVHHQLPEST